VLDLTKAFTPSGALVKAMLINGAQPLTGRYDSYDVNPVSLPDVYQASPIA
jgi:hypothetical protein